MNSASDPPASSSFFLRFILCLQRTGKRTPQAGILPYVSVIAWALIAMLVLLGFAVPAGSTVVDSQITKETIPHEPGNPILRFSRPGLSPSSIPSLRPVQRTREKAGNDQDDSSLGTFGLTRGNQNGEQNSSLYRRLSVTSLIPIESSDSFEGWYAGPGLGQTLSKTPSFLPTPTRPSVSKAGFLDGGFTGYQFNRYGSVELESIDLGQPDLNQKGVGQQDINLHGVSLSALFHYPLTSRVTTFTRAGAFEWESDVTSDPSSDEDIDLLAGVGMDYRLPSPLWQDVQGRFRVEWQRFEFGGSEIDDDVDMVSFRVYFPF